MNVTLRYIHGATQSDRVFDIFSINSEQYDFYRRLHKGLDHGYVEDNLGWKRRISVEFQPLKEDKDKLFWLYQFFFARNDAYTGDSRFISIDGTMVAITLPKDEIKWRYIDDFRYGNALAIDFIEKNWTYITDDGSERILQLTYIPTTPNLSGNTLTIYINLLDDSSIEVGERHFQFAVETDGDVAFGYRHLLELNVGVVVQKNIRDWIRDYCLWGNKKIETTLIDSLNSRKYDVVLNQSGLDWDLHQGIKDALSTRIKFAERKLRTIGEVPQLPFPSLISDHTGIFVTH